MSLALSEHFMYNVVYISMLNNNHKVIGSATGFLYGFCDCAQGSVLSLVTNRHVLSNCAFVQLTFTRAKDSETPDIGNLMQIEIETTGSIFHPTDTIDLAILPIGSAVNAARTSGIDLFYAKFSADAIPSTEEWEKLSAIENVFMAGFPKGFRDEVNNQPIIRSGITATHPALNFRAARNSWLICLASRDAAAHQSSYATKAS